MNALTAVTRTPVDRPAENELDRAEYLANRLARQVDLAKCHALSRVSLEVADAEELAQLLFDSLRTAKRLKGS